MKTKNIFTIIITILFFSIMVILTFSARAIHNASLPHVTAEKLSQQQFPFEYADDTGALLSGTKSTLAVRTELLEKDLYVLYQSEKNGEMRDFVRLAVIEKGVEYNGYTEVLSGIGFGDKVVISWDKELYDGCECVVEK